MLANVTHQIFLPEIKEASKDKQCQNTDANQVQRMHILLRQNFIITSLITQGTTTLLSPEKAIQTTAMDNFFL